MAKNKVLLTGATGFIGTHVLDALVASDFQVRVAGPVPIERMQHVSWKRVDFLEDVDYSELVSGVDAVIHLAAELRDPGKMNRVNIDATGALAEAAEKNGVSLFIYTSSVGVYGHPSAPFVDENTATLSIANVEGNVFMAERFLRDYSVTKLKGEHLMQHHLRDTYGLILRLSNVVSELDIAKVFEWGLLTRIWRGSRRTHQIYVKDVAEAIMFFLEKHFAHQLPIGPNPDIYNISNDNDPENRYGCLFQRYAKATGNWRNGCPFFIPSIFDLIKDSIKFRTLSGALPAGSSVYSPEKLLRAGFDYRYGIGSTQERVIEKLIQRSAI